MTSTSTSTVNQIIEQLKTLTLMETTELINEIESVFGVDASAPVGAVPQMAPGAPESTNAAGSDSDSEQAEPEKSTFKVKLVSINKDNKIKTYKAIRDVTKVGIAESKEFIEKLPTVLKSDASKEELENIKKIMEAVGAEISFD